MYTRRSSSSSSAGSNSSDLSLMSQYYPSTESEGRYNQANGSDQNYYFFYGSQPSSASTSRGSSGRSTPSVSDPPSPMASVNVPTSRRQVMSSRRNSSLPPRPETMSWLSSSEQQHDSWGQFVDPAAADEEIEHFLSSRRRSVR